MSRPLHYKSWNGCDQYTICRVIISIIRAGADVVVYPLKLGGEQIARLIARQSGASTGVEVEVMELNRHKRNIVNNYSFAQNLAKV